MNRTRDDKALKPVGLALAAVVAGISAPVGPSVGYVDPTENTQTRAYTVDASNDAGFDEDPNMVVGASDAVEPFAEKAPVVQGNLFDL